MAEFSSASSGDMYKCNTCFAAFTSMDAVKEHYRNDWHILNAKRRGSNLPPLNRAQFLQYQAANPKKAAKPATKASPSKPTIVPSDTGKSDSAAPTDEKVTMDEDIPKEEEEEEVRPQKPPLPVASNICIF
eukprot:gene40283-49083_t